jgi:hypothetical protein
MFSPLEEIKSLKSVILKLIEIIEDISLDRDDRIELDRRSLYELKQKLQSESQAEVISD